MQRSENEVLKYNNKFILYDHFYTWCDRLKYNSEKDS